MSKYDIVWDINKLERRQAHIQLTLNRRQYAYQQRN